MANEKRLIDANALLQSEVKRCGCIPSIGSGYNNETSFRLILEQAPTVDAVEVVRCKDCKFWDKRDFKKSGICLQKKNPIFFLTDPDFYCAFGERREGE